MEEATYRGTVYPWQCDHVGHMNIMWYVGKFDEANWNLFARLGLTGPQASTQEKTRPRRGFAFECRFEPGRTLRASGPA